MHIKKKAKGILGLKDGGKDDSILQRSRLGTEDDGHSSLKMITDKYLSSIPNMTHNDGSKFLEDPEQKRGKGHNMLKKVEKGDCAINDPPDKEFLLDLSFEIQ